MLLYASHPFEGVKSFNVKTIMQAPLSALVSELKRLGAVSAYVMHDGTKDAQESFITARLDYSSLQKVVTFQRNGRYNFTMTEKNQESTRLRAIG